LSGKFTVIKVTAVNILTLHRCWGLNYRYCPGQRGFKFIVPINAFASYVAPRLAAREKFEVHAV
jgi:hypothetical protein